MVDLWWKIPVMILVLSSVGGFLVITGELFRGTRKRLSRQASTPKSGFTPSHSSSELGNQKQNPKQKKQELPKAYG